MSSYSISSVNKRRLFPTTSTPDDLGDSYDIVIIFHSAEGLSTLNMNRYLNPYFVAKIDNQISFTSTIQSNRSTPKLNNEEWIVRNVPLNARLLVSIYDKDDEKLVDDYIGEFEIVNGINSESPRGGHVIVGSFDRPNGRFPLSIRTTKSSNESQQLPRYTFDGPCRYSRYDSSAVDRVTTGWICSIWKVELRRISFFLPSDEHQQWNGHYKSSNYWGLLPAQSTMKLAHKVLYERTLKCNENGRLSSGDDLWKLIFLDRTTQKLKPRIYTYIIDDNTWQFSEIGHRSLTDFEVKHVRLADDSQCVRFAGEFHLRPKFGWNRFDDQWEIVFDNASGTFSPNDHLLDNLKNMFLFNFPGLNLVTYDYKDPKLKESIEQIELAANNFNYTTTTKINKLVPFST